MYGVFMCTYGWCLCLCMTVCVCVCVYVCVDSLIILCICGSGNGIGHRQKYWGGLLWWVHPVDYCQITIVHVSVCTMPVFYTYTLAGCFSENGRDRSVCGCCYFMCNLNSLGTYLGYRKSPKYREWTNLMTFVQLLIVLRDVNCVT